VIEHNLVRYGLASRCARVRAGGFGVLALEDPQSGALDRLSAEIEAAKREEHAEAIVLGCAGMADLAAVLSEKHGLPVIEGVSAAVALAEGLMKLGLKTSKRGGYARPPAKPYAGAFSAFAYPG
jgi:allantoin racemase